VHLERKLALVP